MEQLVSNFPLGRESEAAAPTAFHDDAQFVPGAVRGPTRSTS